MENEPGLTILALFDQLIDRIKQRSPTRTDGKPGTLDPAPAPAGGAPAAAPAPAVSDEMKKSMQAAYKVALLSRTMLKVTTNDEYSEYPTGRHLDFAYGNLLNAIRPDAPATVDTEGQARLAAAQALLYQKDAQGHVIGNTPLYDAYLKNASALSVATSNFNAAFNAARRDPILFESWPQDSVLYIDAQKQAKDALNLGGAVEVETALDAVASIGRPYQAAAISEAIADFTAWDLGLAGVATKIPYSFILPANWCDPDDHEGMEHLHIEQSLYSSYNSTASSSSSQNSWHQHAASASGSAAVSLGFLGFGGSHSTSSTSAGWQDSSASQLHEVFQNSAKNLRIDLEFVLCTIERPWLTSDLFAMQGWGAVGIQANGISDGTIDGQVNSQDKLIPMIPQQFLIVRNVNISSSDWGADGDILQGFYGGAATSSATSAASSSGAVGACLGFLNFGGSARFSRSSAEGASSNWAAASSSSHFGTTFENNVLSIPGAQIVAFLSDIVPACPKKDG